MRTPKTARTAAADPARSISVRSANARVTRRTAERRSGVAGSVGPMKWANLGKDAPASGLAAGEEEHAAASAVATAIAATSAGRLDRRIPREDHDDAFRGVR